MLCYLFPRVPDAEEKYSLLTAVGNTRGSGDSYLPIFSGDGRFLIFGSKSINFTSPNLQFANPQYYMVNLSTREITLLSKFKDGSSNQSGAETELAAAIDFDGNTTAFSSAGDLLKEFEDDTDARAYVRTDDLCPEDGNKTEPGDCGCGVEDVDTDSDGVSDCASSDPDASPSATPTAKLVSV